MLSFLFNIGNRSASSGKVASPMAPDGVCVYAIGDIHGCLSALHRLLDAIRTDFHALADAEGLAASIVFLGDYVDRGPDSRGVLDVLSRGDLGIPCRFLRGNHEQAMLDFLSDPVRQAAWLTFGGVETLASYGVPASVGTSDPKRLRAMRDGLDERLPPRHRAFLADLETMAVLGDYAFVHAGVRPGVGLNRQRIEDLLWIREPFLTSRRRHEKVIVHGHTVTEEPESLPNRIGVDTGAYAAGPLTAVALHGTARRFIQVPGD